MEEEKSCDKLKKKPGKYRRNVLFVFYVIIVSAVITELIASILLSPIENMSDPYSYSRLNPDTVTKHRIGKWGSVYWNIWKNTGENYHVSIGSRGLRGDNPSPKSIKNRKVLLCLGDSCTFGLGVNDSETYPYLLNIGLQSSNNYKEWVAINAGISMMNTETIKVILKRELKGYAAEKIIIALGANDGSKVLKTPFKLRTYDPESLNFRINEHKITIWLRSRYLYNVPKALRFRFKRSWSTENPTQVEPDVYKKNLEFLHGDYKPEDVLLLSICISEGYKKIQKEVAEQKGAFWIDADKILNENNITIKNDKRFKKESKKILSLFPTEVLKEHPELWTTIDGCHPNVIGHKLINEAILKEFFGLP